MIPISEYKKQYYATHPFAKDFGGISDFEAELYYYIDEVSKDNQNIDAKYRGGIEDLTNRFIIEQLPFHNTDNISVDLGDWLQLMIMLQKCGLKKEELEKWDDSFYSTFFEKKILPESSKDFHAFWFMNEEFHDFRLNYYSKIRIGTTERELLDQQSLFRRYRDKINSIRMETPLSFMNWVNQCCYYYEHLPKILDYPKTYYANFIENILALGIAECRNNADYTSLSRYIIYRERMITANESSRWRKNLRKLVDVLTCYGEEPSRLLWLFAGFAVIFTTIYSLWPGLIGIKGRAIDKVISALYFYITTSLTVGYGDLTPVSNMGKILVMINELSGFCIGGAFISLSLRKLFRY